MLSRRTQVTHQPLFDGSAATQHRVATSTVALSRTPTHTQPTSTASMAQVRFENSVLFFLFVCSISFCILFVRYFEIFTHSNENSSLCQALFEIRFILHFAKFDFASLDWFLLISFLNFSIESHFQILVSTGTPTKVCPYMWRKPNNLEL